MEKKARNLVQVSGFLRDYSFFTEESRYLIYLRSLLRYKMYPCKGTSGGRKPIEIVLQKKYVRTSDYYYSCKNT